jgi:hypothetical protein
MRHLIKIAAAGSLLASAFFSNAEAAFIGAPMNLGIRLEHIRFDTQTLAPMAHTRFFAWNRPNARSAKSFSEAVALSRLVKQDTL